SPSGLYVGWHALVYTPQLGSLKVPEWLLGERYPVSGLSGLSPGAVSAAIRDFLRVSPQVQVLEVEISSPISFHRSNSVDERVLNKIGELARNSHSIEGIGGVRVLDTPNRLGHLPSLDDLQEEISLARPGFSVEWSFANSEAVNAAHVTVMEGSAASVIVNA